MFDAVLGYHLNPKTCGVAKFNVQLAKRLGVPVRMLRGMAYDFQNPLISIKTSEIGPSWRTQLPQWGNYSLLLHDRPEGPPPSPAPAKTWYADETGCPATIEGDGSAGVLDVLCFGMAHKLQAPYFEKLKKLLDLTTSDYTVSASTAIHEGSPWESLAEAETLLRDVFGSRLRMLGFLADDGLLRAMRSAQMAALFFSPAARANNTTLWACANAGLTTITNLDGLSPPSLRHGANVYDIAKLESWPGAMDRLDVRYGALRASRAHGWDALLNTLHG